MAEVDKWRYGAGSDQNITEKTPQTKQRYPVNQRTAMNNHRNFKSEFDWWYCH